MKTAFRVLAMAPVLGLFLVTATPAQAAQSLSTASTTATAKVQQAAVTQSPWPVLRKGANSAWFPVTVRSLQYLLNAHGARITVDGLFGSATDGAVRTYQRARGLAVDGVVGAATWSSLLVTVRWGSTGSAVRAVQDQINFRRGLGGEALLSVDGVFGPRTDAAVRQFQEVMALQLPVTVDGIVGPATWRGLITGYVGPE